MAINYTWAVQRQRNGLWSHRAEFGEPLPGPRGMEDSDDDPYDFVRALAERLHPEGHWRIAVWDTLRVDQPPIAALEGGRPEG